MPHFSAKHHFLQNIPTEPGVYKMKNANQDIIYVGKAKNLKKRVSSYFQNKNHSTRTKKMVEQITDIEFLITNSELESLILETSLIKELRPKYNILMKDDKNFSYIRISTNEDFPRVSITRKIYPDKAHYFGPKTSSDLIKQSLKLIRQFLPFRNCKLDIKILANNSIDQTSTKTKVKVTKANINYPCLDYHIKRCLAPCAGYITKDDYTKIIQQLINFLEGKTDKLLEYFKSEMFRFASEKKFEIAAKFRDRIQNLENILREQIIENPEYSDTDVINFYPDHSKLYFNLFQIRSGKIIDQHNLILKINELEESIQNSIKTQNNLISEAITAFIQQYYSDTNNLPKTILLPFPPNNQKLLQNWLKKKSNNSIRFQIPERGLKNELLELSFKNALNFAKQSKTRWETNLLEERTQALEQLKNLLNLKSKPKRLECYDISHLGGTQTVSSMVVFKNGLPSNQDYRHFKIFKETAGRPNDFASIKETLTRRLKYLTKPNKFNLKLKLIPSSNVKNQTTSGKIEIFEKTKIQSKEKKQKTQTLIHLGTINFSTFKTTSNHQKKIFKLDSNNSELLNYLNEITLLISKKLKINRLYFISEKNNELKFLTTGFRHSKKVPASINLNKNEILIFIDLTKTKPDPSFNQKPDLIIIDGGKGQLSSALIVLKNYNLNIPIISLAKRFEEIFIPEKKQSILYPEGHPVRQLLEHIRNEAHRFAITYQKNLRLNNYKQSALDQIEGIGAKTKIKLLKHFGTIEQIKNANFEEIQKLTNLKTAQIIKSKLT